MHAPDRMIDRMPIPILRGLAVLGFLALFFAAASLIKPQGSRATTVRPDGPLDRVQEPHPDIPRLKGVELPALLGTLSGRDYLVEVYVTRQGPRYSVLDASGTKLAELLSDDELYEQFPDLDVRQMQAGQVGEADVEIDE